MKNDRNSWPMLPFQSVRAFVNVLLAVMTVLLLVGCTRSVEWREEVPLNTGETIWVERRGSYRFGSESGSPFQFGYQDERVMKLEFNYRGKRYTYESDAMLQVLAISPEGIPNLVAMVSAYEAGLQCSRPSYVQLRPDETAQRWLRVDRIDTWLHDKPTNLLFALPPFEERTITAAERSTRNTFNYVAGNQYRWVDPTYDCKRRG
jgi:hypothetical protein